MARVIQVRGRAQLDAVLAELDATVDPNMVIVVHNTVIGGKRVMPVYSVPQKRNLEILPVTNADFAAGAYSLLAAALAANDVVSVDASGVSGATCALNLPGSSPDGSTITVSLSDVPPDAPGLSINATSPDTIDGNPIVLTLANQQVSFVYNADGDIWLQI